MKILQIGPYPPPLGGWSFHIQKFQEYLTEHGVQNEVLNIGAERRQEIEGCISVLSIWDYCHKQIEFLRQGYTLYNHVDGCSWKGFVLTIITQLLSILFLKRAHLSFHAGVDQYCFNKGHYFYKFLGYCCFNLAGEIVCNGDLVKKKITGFRKSPRMVHAVPCFSAQYLDFERQLTHRQRSFIDEHEPLLFTYVFFRKGYAIRSIWKVFSEILEQYPKAGLIVVGSKEGSDEYFEEAQQKGIEKQLLLTGGLSHDNFLSLLKESDLYLRTPITDGVCSSVLESFALGTPVVASYNELRPEMVITYEYGNESDFLEKVKYTLKELLNLKEQLISLKPRDTFKEELDVLTRRV